jgi:hypothetical protein
MSGITPLARQLIARAGDRSSIPRYGSPEWDALPDQDPRRAAAILIAAEAWRDHCSPVRVAEDMRDSLTEISDVIAHMFVGTSHDVAQAVDWEAIFSRPTFAELCERRGEPQRARRGDAA